MDIERLSKQQLEAVVKELLKQEHLNPIFLEAMILANQSEDMKFCVDSLHNYLCDYDHDSGACEYYDETQKEDTWKQSAHMHWTKRTMDFMEDHGIDHEEDLRGILGRISYFHEMLHKEHQAVRTLLGLFLTRP